MSGTKEPVEKVNEDIEKAVIERMSQISSELAHDLRSPLQTIQNAIYLLEKTPDNPMLFDMIRQSLKQATYLLDSFRDYYKAHIIMSIETEYSKIIDLAFSDLEIPENIKMKRGGALNIYVRTDPAKIALAIRHLVINAIEAMPEGGELSLTVIDNNETIDLTVRDTGAGLSPEVEEILYVPFQTRKQNGKGLGVPTAKRIVESHDGALTYETTEGVGTVFIIKLPRPTETL